MPTNIADFLLLNQRMPRSLSFCYYNLTQSLRYLAENYGESPGCLARAEKMLARLTGSSISDVFDTGLHEFLGDFIRDNNQLGEEISTHYRFY